MPLRTRRLGANVAAVLLAAALPLVTIGFAANPASAGAHVKRGGTLSVDVYGTTWPSFLPWETSQQLSGQPLFDLFASSLFNHGANNAVLPGLADSYSFLKGGTVLKITLRKGLKFQDGTPLNAQAVVYNWQQDRQRAITTNATTGIGAYATNFVALNGLTAEIQMSQPYPPAIGALCNNSFGWMISPTEVASKGIGGAGLMPDGAGPYEITNNVENSSITYQKWPGFWNAKNEGYLQTINVTNVGDESSALLALQSGQAQALIANGGLDANEVVQAKSDGLKVIFPPETWTDFVEFNLKPSYPTANINARLAMMYATDRPAIDKALFGGQYTVIDEMIAKGEIGYSQNIPGMPNYNPSKARSLVASIPGGLSVTIQPIVNTPAFVDLAETLQSEWQQVGIKVSINAVAETQALTYLTAGTLQVFLSQVGGVVDPALGSLETFYHDAALGNSDGTELGMINRSHQLATNGARSSAYVALSRYAVAQHAYTFPLFGKSSTFAVAQNVEGLTGTGIPSIFLDRAWLS